MKSSRLLFILCLFLFFPNSVLWSQEPAVRNVEFTQRPDSNVEVTYDLVGDPSKKYAVKLSLVKSGSRGVLPVSKEALSGDVGESVSPGLGRTIIWNLRKDYPQGLEGEDFVFIVDVVQQRDNSKLPWISDRRFGIGLNIGASWLKGDRADTPISPLVSGHFRILPHPSVGLSIELGYSRLKYSLFPGFENTTRIIPIELSVIYFFLPSKKVNPYFFAGGGGISWKVSNSVRGSLMNVLLKTGGGIEFRVSPRVGIDVGATYRHLTFDGLDNPSLNAEGASNDGVLDVHAGLTYYFGKKKNGMD